MIKLFNDFILHSRIASGPPVDIWKATFIKELTTIGLEGLQHRADRGAGFVLRIINKLPALGTLRLESLKNRRKKLRVQVLYKIINNI